MGIHRDLRMKNVLQATILYAEFIDIPTNNKLDKAVGYIYDNKLWERCYILLKILFPCLRVLHLADINCAGMEKFHYYLIMIKQCIEKTISNIDYQYSSQTYRY